ncbi:MAG: PspC domain-containing protein [Pseudonocardiaceae bacterium]
MPVCLVTHLIIRSRYGWDANAVRLVFVLSCLLPGPQFVVYLALWVLMPKRPY